MKSYLLQCHKWYLLIVVYVVLCSFNTVPATHHLLRPADPAYVVPPGPLCGNISLPVINHTSGINYNVGLRFFPNGGTPVDTSFVVVNSNVINIPAALAPCAGGGFIYIIVQAVDAASGVTSDYVSTLIWIGKPAVK